MPEMTLAKSSGGPNRILSRAMVAGEALTESSSMPKRGTNWELRKKKKEYARDWKILRRLKAVELMSEGKKYWYIADKIDV